MSFFSSPGALDYTAAVLAILAGVGLVSLFFFPADRPLAKRLLMVLFVVALAVSGVFAWQAGALREADRDLTPAQQAALAKVVRRFPGVEFSVMTSRDDAEAGALARKLVDTIKVDGGAKVTFWEGEMKPLKGVALAVRSRQSGPGLALDAVGRALIAAGIAGEGDALAAVPDNAMWIVVGKKP